MSDSQSSSWRRGGRCCLLGFGGCLVLVALLLATSWWGYRRWGSPWLEAQKAELGERFPALRSVLVIKDSLSIEGLDLRAREVGERQREAFPADVWLPEEALLGAGFNITLSAAQAALTLPAQDATALASRLREQMTILGWQRVPVSDPHDGIVLVFTKDERHARYTIFATDEGLEFWVASEKPPGSVRSEAP